MDCERLELWCISHSPHSPHFILLISVSGSVLTLTGLFIMFSIMKILIVLLFKADVIVSFLEIRFLSFAKLFLLLNFYLADNLIRCSIEIDLALTFLGQNNNSISKFLQ